MSTASRLPGNCMDCVNREIIPDPEPHDWFCDDDKALLCRLVQNDKRNPASEYQADRHELKAVTVSCRPYNLRKESEVPDWCPLRKAKSQSASCQSA